MIGSPLKIAIVVHGRFHAFDLARELLVLGHDVTLFTNYPTCIAERYGVPRRKVRSFLYHGMLTRSIAKVNGLVDRQLCERALHSMFGKWAARQLRREVWDVVHCWSGVSEEFLSGSRDNVGLTLLMRGSSHIVTQARLLREESLRTGCKQEQPSNWMTERECREYVLADRILVLSSFAVESFVSQGVSTSKVSVVNCGVDVRHFRLPASAVQARCNRIESGSRLRILFVGTFCYRKGIFDLEQIVKGLPSDRFEFTFVGPVAAEARQAKARLEQSVMFVPKQPQAKLPGWYAASDIFVFPTIEDGFPTVLAQASAAALPILTTPNGAGADLVDDGVTGWVLPVRDAGAFIDSLLAFDRDKDGLSAMVRRANERPTLKDWADVAREFEATCRMNLPS